MSVNEIPGDVKTRGLVGITYSGRMLIRNPLRQVVSSLSEAAMVEVASTSDFPLIKYYINDDFGFSSV